MAQPPIFSFEGLALQQGGRWLFGGPTATTGAAPIDLHVLPGDRLALIGRNGAGKTTLLRRITGKIDADRGQRRIKPGTNIVFLEQDPDFSSAATLMDWALGGEDAPEAHEVEAIAGQLGIDMSREAVTASGGERRRAAIARALAPEPKLIIADEPVSALDVSIQSQILNLLKKLQKDLGLTLVFISHDLGVVHYLADRIAVMYQGKIVESGTADEVFHHPQNDYTKRLLMAIPRLAGHSAA